MLILSTVKINSFAFFIAFFIAKIIFFVYYINMAIDISEYIDLCLVKKGKMSHAELARLTEQKPQVIFKKFKNGTFKIAELEKIAEALNCELKISFIDKDTKEPLI